MRNIVAALLFTMAAFGQENIEYQKPPKEILQLADYQRSPSVWMDSRNHFMVLAYRDTYKSLDDLNQEEMRLGGLRINPSKNISSTITYVNDLKVRKVAGGEPRNIKGLPANAKIANVRWSPDEKKIAFTHTVADGLELFVMNLESATAVRLASGLNANAGNPITWFGDSQSLLIRKLPANRQMLIDSKKDLPAGPIISTADGSKSQNRTYQDLLKNRTDETNFETLVTATLEKVSLDGNSQSFLQADMYIGENFSPDGSLVMVTTLKKPFSYIVPLSRFPQQSAVYDQSAKQVAIVNDVPISEIMPKGFMAVRKGKRQMSWRDDKPATLSFVEALDQGDPAIKVDFRDELFSWDAPFDKTPRSVFKTPQRFSNVVWGDDSQAVVYDQWYDTRNEKTYVVNPMTGAFKIFDDRNSQDIYADPGRFETERNSFNRDVLAIRDGNYYLIGDGFSTAGQFPFIDAVNAKTLKKQRLYQLSDKSKKEDILSIIDFKERKALVQLQSGTEYPNYFIRSFGKKKSLGRITDFANPFESIRGVHKEVITYKRKDGLPLSGTLYLPAGYDRTKKEKLPLLIWAYPAEFKDRNSAGQNSQNANDFTAPYYGSFVYWVTQGYAVLDDASFPIIGEGTTEPNDNFISQLVDNAEAAIDAVDKLGYIDRNRVGVGGHSYGAFMTANLLTHSNLFACGIARSGAYNRTLTPFGFQSEQRNYWESPEVYNTMSPFMNASKMKTPMLLVHGEADNNPGTFTLQTERYFQALKGLGAPVRMVILPKESHGYAAKENIFHLLWEQDRFLEKYLKNAKSVPATEK